MLYGGRWYTETPTRLIAYGRKQIKHTVIIQFVSHMLFDSSCLKKQDLDALLPHLNYYPYVLACMRNYYETVLSSNGEYVDALGTACYHVHSPCRKNTEYVKILGLFYKKAVLVSSSA